MNICSIAGCAGKYKGLGYCDKHYQRFKKRGTIEGFAKRESHRLKNRSEYEIWCGIKKRCYNKNAIQYAYYGGRGIKMCGKWNDSFLVFLKDMGERPSPKHSIDRINNDGDYEPSNCRWATRRQQALNKRVKNRYGYKGIRWTQRLKKWESSIHCRPIKRIYLGAYETKEEAALAYDCAAIQLFDNEAILNFSFMELK